MMGDPTVNLRMRADVANALKGVLKLVDAQDKQTRSLKKTAAASRSSAFNLGKVSRQFSMVSRSIATLGGGVLAGAGLSSLFRGYVTAVKAASDKTNDFERELTGLLSLGDNVNNIQKIKNSVIDLSNATSLARQEIADTLFRLQSGGSFLAKNIQDDLARSAIEIQKLTGATLQGSVTAMLKTWNIYGDTLGNVKDAQNKLIFAADIADLKFEDLAIRLADLIAPAKGLGVSLSEVLGILTTTTQKGGAVEKVFTDTRNALLRLNTAVERGLISQGSLVEMFAQLAKFDSNVLADIFGVRVAGTAANIAESTRQIANDIARFENLQGDIFKQKFNARLQDPTFARSELISLFQRTSENQTLITSFGETAQKLALLFEVRKLDERKKLDENATLIATLTPQAWNPFLSKLLAGIGIGGGLNSLEDIVNSILVNDRARAKGANVEDLAGTFKISHLFGTIGEVLGNLDLQGLGTEADILRKIFKDLSTETKNRFGLNERITTDKTKELDAAFEKLKSAAEKSAKALGDESNALRARAAADESAFKQAIADKRTARGFRASRSNSAIALRSAELDFEEMQKQFRRRGPRSATEAERRQLQIRAAQNNLTSLRFRGRDLRIGQRKFQHMRSRFDVDAEIAGRKTISPFDSRKELNVIGLARAEQIDRDKEAINSDFSLRGARNRVARARAVREDAKAHGESVTLATSNKALKESIDALKDAIVAVNTNERGEVVRGRSRRIPTILLNSGATAAGKV